MNKANLFRNVITASILAYSGSAMAQVPCYSAAQCAQIRIQAEQQMVAQQAAIAAQAQENAREQRRQNAIAAQARKEAEIRAHDAELARAREAAEQQVAYDQARKEAEIRARDAELARAREAAEQQVAYDRERQRVKMEAETRAAAQLAAENSPDNRCHDQKTAGLLLGYFNGLQGAADYNGRAIDIDHLTTIKFDADHSVISCHGAFVLQDGRMVVGTLSTRLNVAGNLLTTFHVD